MRLALWLAIASFALGAAPALALDAASTPAYPVETEQKPPAKHVAKPTAKHAAVKPAVKPATAKAAEPAAKPAPKPAATVATAKAEPAKPESNTDALAGIPADERLAIQSALLWSGDYNGTAPGDDPMLAAIKNYQKRAKAKVTGELSAAERANLVAAAHEHEQQYGWSVVVDPATGVRLGIPAKLTPLARDAARGTRWSSAHGEVQIETFRVKSADLAAVFEQEKKKPSRKVESSGLQGDRFAISGMQGLKEFSVHAQMRDGEVRGVTIMFDQMMEGIVAPVTAAMASAFSPFPERSAPYAALARPVEYGTGLIVTTRGDIVTDRKLTQGCRVIVAKGFGDAERITEDPESGLALLRVYGAHRFTPLYLSSAAPKAGDLTLVGMPDPKDQDGRKPLTEIKARLGGSSAVELREPVPMAGFSGAAALDAQGKFLGMIEMGDAVLASAGPVLPPVRLVPAQTIRAFLEARDVAPTAASDTIPRARQSCA